MIDPASKDDVAEARDAIIARIEQLDRAEKLRTEGSRQQNSAEHGSILSKLLHVTEAVHWLKTQWTKLMNLPLPPDPPKKP